METREQRALLSWFMAQTHNVDQAQNYKAVLAKSNACPRCWLQPRAGRNREQPTALTPDRGALICPACREQFSVLDR